MITRDEHSAAAGSEGVHVLAGGIVMQLASLPVLRCASLLVPPGSSRLVIATLFFESTLCLVMLVDKIRWRKAWLQKQRSHAREAEVRGGRIEQVAADFFLNEIVYYPSWFQRSRGHVPARITEAVKVAPDAVKLKISGVEYLFTFSREGCGQNGNQCKLDVSVDDCPVLSLSAAISGDPGTMHTARHHVSALVEGPWVQELLALSEEAMECHRAQIRLRREKPLATT